MDELNTDEMRRRVKDRATYNVVQLEKDILATLNEIDRLREELERVNPLSFPFVKRVEQRTKEAIWKGLNDAPTIWHKGVQYLRVSVVKQAIDSAKIK